MFKINDQIICNISEFAEFAAAQLEIFTEGEGEVLREDHTESSGIPIISTEEGWRAVWERYLKVKHDKADPTVKIHQEFANYLRKCGLQVGHEHNGDRNSCLRTGNNLILSLRVEISGSTLATCTPINVSLTEVAQTVVNWAHTHAYGDPD